MATQTTDPLHHVALLAEDTRREADALDFSKIPVEQHELVRAATGHFVRGLDLLCRCDRRRRPDFVVPPPKAHRQERLDLST
jgi:hypothetical protein